ncbi:hypothetical protein DLJ53_03695 [Acuticoccus sediminis]|uniref:Uncharacterized protein n=1 Tax=Acuticoccus sediminis TaxID=2184697 RepID=A0A8B2P2X2_9HYPH|nr:hypothetical protein [Acuticoccus sediminis]RAI04496.1 hypothetical protein DLJ53_03695 [Acuticoccus sediminis]
MLLDGSSARALEPAKGLTPALITDEVIAEVREFLASPLVAMSIAMQNERRHGVSQERIDALDKQWRAEADSERKPLISATLSSPLSTYLTRVQARSLGRYCEIFVMDAYGLNVGQSSITSDYWQGDEAKWQKTYPKGPDAVFIDEAEWNEETRTWRAQLSLTVTEPGTGRAIGAATIELNLTELQRQAFTR